MNISFLLSIILIVMTSISVAQIRSDSPKKLPDDLSTETILFLKFDSVNILTPRPDAMSKEDYKKWTDHNKNVPKYNAQLREYASKYPFAYKIVSMTDKDNYRSHGAKYMFWVNSFDAFTSRGSHAEGILGHIDDSGTYCASSVPNTEIGILDLTSDKTYLVDKRISVSMTYRYDKMVPQLLRMIGSQFGTTSKK